MGRLSGGPKPRAPSNSATELSNTWAESVGNVSAWPISSASAEVVAAPRMNQTEANLKAINKMCSNGAVHCGVLWEFVYVDGIWNGQPPRRL